MFKFLEQKQSRKTVIYFLIFGFFALGLFLLTNKFDAMNVFEYNQNNEVVLAAEEKPINCRKQTEIRLPATIPSSISIGPINIPIPGGGGEISAAFGPNEFEIPTGELTDKTEDLAKRILEQLPILIGAADRENEEARTLINLAGQCTVSNCSTPGCQERDYDCAPCLSPVTNPDGTIGCDQWSRCPWCPPPPSCGGQACPSGINENYQRIENQKNIVSSAANMIKNILEDKRNKPVGLWWLPGCPPGPLTGCVNDKEFVLEELERARSGNYRIFFGEIIPGCDIGEECRPPGLEDCVIRPQDIEEVLKGEKTGKYLFSCREAVIAGVIESNDCYGYNEATEAWRQRAENYYCCE